MDLSVNYMGLELAHPLMPGASPMVDDLDMVKRLADAGASAIVMHSLFEEQVTAEQLATDAIATRASDLSAEAGTFMPVHPDFNLGPEEYLEQIARIKALVEVPVIASLNGTTPGGWLEYARLMQDAGADALELNVYELPTDAAVDAAAIETRTSEMVTQVKWSVQIPVAVKLSPFYTSIPHVAQRLAQAGADALVLFNRFYQPDIDIESLSADSRLVLSTPAELPMRLRWLAILSGKVNCSLAVTGGVHTAGDAIKSLMAGASAVQMVSSLLRYGPQHLQGVLANMKQWLEDHEYQSVREMIGSMDLTRTPDPHNYERANYVHLLQSWRP